MANTTSNIIRSEPNSFTVYTPPKRSPLWQQVALGAVMLISIFMNFFQLGQNGFGTYFYASGVRSMLDSWHNFFFVSYDPGGFVTIDKPPLGFWLEVVTSKIFGFTPFSVFLPQALAGVLSVLVLFFLVRRHFGAVAGLLAALALAVSPISVVTARYHTIDSTLALALLLGAWAVLRAAETGRLRWLLLSAVMVGLGFNIKMLEAYLVVPAFGLLYLLAAPKSIGTRIVHLLLATLVLVVVSFSWIAAVDLTPASQRPYVGSTQDNSELSLALGYNGIERLLGRFGGGGRGGAGGATGQTTTRNGNGGTTGGTTRNGNGGTSGITPNGSGGTISGTAGAGGNAGQGGNFANFGNGTASPFRLFSSQLGGQIAWLLPFALLGMLALAWQRRFRLQRDRQQQSLIFWGMWLLTMGIFFSVAGFFQPYYMTEMAPAICALFGIGLVVMWHDFQQPGWRGWLLPIALVLTAAEQIYLLSSYPAWSRWLTPVIIVLSVIAVASLIIVRLAPRLRASVFRPRFLVAFVGAGVLALLLAPSVWAAIPVIQNTTAFTPTAGPSQRGDGGFGGGTDTVDPKLLSYLEANQGSAKYLVATPSSMSADGIILATNKPVMALGGFSGSDPILTTSQLQSLIANGTIRYFLLNAPRTGQQIPSQTLNRIPAQYRNAVRNGNYGGFGGQQSALTTWITKNCTTVSTNLWQSTTAASTNTGGGYGRGGANKLYECAAPQS